MKGAKRKSHQRREQARSNQTTELKGAKRKSHQTRETAKEQPNNGTEQEEPEPLTNSNLKGTDHLVSQI